MTVASGWWRVASVLGGAMRDSVARTAVMRRILVVLTLSVLCHLVSGASAPVFAQTETATLSGVIQDRKGAQVPEVEVVATRIETGRFRRRKQMEPAFTFFRA